MPTDIQVLGPYTSRRGYAPFSTTCAFSVGSHRLTPTVLSRYLFCLCDSGLVPALILTRSTLHVVDRLLLRC